MSTEDQLRDILTKYKSLFKEDNGKVKGTKATFALKENA